MNKIPMTAEGYAKLKEDLNNLVNIQRPKIIEAIAEARSHGDLSENAEYQYAKEQQSLIEGKIQELESATALSEIILLHKRLRSWVLFRPMKRLLLDGLQKIFTNYLTKNSIYYKNDI